jgi:hypothetical protein
MPRVGFEPATPVSERAMKVRALDRAVHWKQYGRMQPGQPVWWTEIEPMIFKIQTRNATKSTRKRFHRTFVHILMIYRDINFDILSGNILYISCLFYISYKNCSAETYYV